MSTDNRLEDLLAQERQLRQALISQHATELSETHAAHTRAMTSLYDRMDERVMAQITRAETLADRHAEQIGGLLDQLSEMREQHATQLTAERAAHRDEMRELLNRIQHPAVMPTGTRLQRMPADPAADARQQRRALFTGTGRIDPLQPHDPVNGDEPEAAE